MKLANFNKNSIMTKEELNQFYKEALEEVVNDEEIKEKIISLGISKSKGKKMDLFNQNASIILDYKDDINYCRNCPGLNKCQKIYRHLQMDINLVNENIIEKSFKVCELKKIKEKEDRNYLLCDFDEKYRNISLKNINLRLLPKNLVSEFENILGNKKNKWLYITAPGNSDKTYLSIALVNELIKQGRGPVVFLDSLTRFAELNNLLFNKNPEYNDKLALYS
ncbi:MAG: hypothetical protein HUJ61_05205, partial [Bacilli bacterium]|nr:hypothetical protein [Bacilli bacterium]